MSVTVDPKNVPFGDEVELVRFECGANNILKSKLRQRHQLAKLAGKKYPFEYCPFCGLEEHKVLQ